MCIAGFPFKARASEALAVKEMIRSNGDNNTHGACLFLSEDGKLQSQNASGVSVQQ